MRDGGIAVAWWTTMLTWALFVILALVTAMVLGGYNQLTRSRNRVREAWSGVDVQLRRRASLIPNLIDAVQAYAQHERTTFDEVTRARSALQQAAGAGEVTNASNVLSQALGRLFAVVESYPQLRASENFARLENELADIEEKIAFARQFYNRNVLDYNTRLEVFPTIMMARAFDFSPMEFFDAGDEGRAEVSGRFMFPRPAAQTPPPAA
jgi:LemA protein